MTKRKQNRIIHFLNSYKLLDKRFWTVIALDLIQFVLILLVLILFNLLTNSLYSTVKNGLGDTTSISSIEQLSNINQINQTSTSLLMIFILGGIVSLLLYAFAVYVRRQVWLFVMDAKLDYKWSWKFALFKAAYYILFLIVFLLFIRLLALAPSSKVLISILFSFVLLLLYVLNIKGSILTIKENFVNMSKKILRTDIIRLAFFLFLGFVIVNIVSLILKPFPQFIQQSGSFIVLFLLLAWVKLYSYDYYIKYEKKNLK